jgi:hypothetical protein
MSHLEDPLGFAKGCFSACLIYLAIAAICGIGALIAFVLSL